MNKKTFFISVSSIRLLAIFLFVTMLSYRSHARSAETSPDAEVSSVVEDPRPVQTIQLLLPRNASPVIKNIASLFTRQVQQRCEATVVQGRGPGLTVELILQPGIGEEGFRIADGKEGAISIIGNDERGILYGIGKFLRISRYDQGGFTAGAWRGTSVPEKAVRGIYLATHFNNFYDVAPEIKLQHYVEDMALWGLNMLLLWYDWPTFDGFDDPTAVKARKRLRVILKAAHDLGIDAAWADQANAGYRNSPDSIRAVTCPTKGHQNVCDICPSRPGGTEYILSNTARILDEFKDVSPKYYIIWPYDSGGCCCDQCSPWGNKGFLRMARLMADQQKKYIPKAKTILSSWYFSPSEWVELNKQFSDNAKPWLDYMVNEWLDDASRPIGKPGNLPVLSFPEITMLGMYPWGGYGAAPMPKRFQKEWLDRGQLMAGGFPYSEGIYDDINKAIYVQFYWQSSRSAIDIVKEYIAFEYSPDVVEDMSRAIELIEMNSKRDQITSSAGEAYLLVQKAESRLTHQSKQAWRWRLIALRALIDKEMFRIHPTPVFQQEGGRDQFFTAKVADGEVLKAAFEELREIYHADRIDEKNGNIGLAPPKVITGK